MPDANLCSYSGTNNNLIFATSFNLVIVIIALAVNLSLTDMCILFSGGTIEVFIWKIHYMHFVCLEINHVLPYNR